MPTEFPQSGMHASYLPTRAPRRCARAFEIKLSILRSRPGRNLEFISSLFVLNIILIVDVALSSRSWKSQKNSFLPLITSNLNKNTFLSKILEVNSLSKLVARVLFLRYICGMFIWKLPWEWEPYKDRTSYQFSVLEYFKNK